MASANRGVVNTLLTAVIVLALGMAALLWVANNRHQRLQDETEELRRDLKQKNSQIEELKVRLRKCDTIEAVLDTSWDTQPGTATGVAKRRVS